MPAEYDDMLATIFECGDPMVAAQKQQEQTMASSSSKDAESFGSSVLVASSLSSTISNSNSTRKISPKNFFRESGHDDSVEPSVRRAQLRVEEKCYLIKLAQNARMGRADSNDLDPSIGMYKSVANALRKKFAYLHLDAEQCQHTFHNTRSSLIKKLKSGKPLKQAYSEYMKLFEEDPQIQDILNGGSGQRSRKKPKPSRPTYTSQESKEYSSKSFGPNGASDSEETMSEGEFAADPRFVLRPRGGLGFEEKCYLIKLIQTAKSEDAEEATISWDLVASALKKKFGNVEINADQCRGCYYTCKYNFLKRVKSGKRLRPRQVKLSQLFKDDPHFQEAVGGKGAAKGEEKPRVTQSVSRDSKRSSDEPSQQSSGQQEAASKSLCKRIKIEHKLARVIYEEVEVGADNSDSELEEPFELPPGMSLTEEDRLAIEEISLRGGLSVQQVLDQMSRLDVSSRAAGKG